MTPEDKAPVNSEIEVIPDPELSFPARRRAGHDQCPNCGTHLKGPFCHYCGQPDKHFLRFFPVLMREFMEDLLDLDSRFARTMKPLLFKPGRLTRDYIDGRRFRYTPPIRLYLFSSILFFLLSTILASQGIESDLSFDGAPGVSGQVTLEADSELDAAEVQKALEALPEEVRNRIKVAEPGESNEPQEKNFFSDNQISFNGEPWDAETNPLDVPFFPQWVNDWVNREIGESPEKARRIEENPNLIVDQILDLLPGTMFVLLPVVALIFKFWYLFSRRYYVEHLVLALHNHSFVFIWLMAAFMLELLESWSVTNGYEWLRQAVTWTFVVISVWLPIYMVVSLRYVYQQGWILTFFKAIVIGLSYITLLGFVAGLVAMLGFLLL